MEHGRVEIVHVDGVADDVESEVVGLAVDEPRFRPPPASHML